MVEILLAVHNGEKYLEKQLCSILNQSFEEWRLLIYDDGSNDGTENLILKYVETYENKIKYFKSSKNSGSAKLSFFKLLKLCTAKYVCFCDQDDFWEKDKLKISMDAIKEMEKKYGEIPILIHTDLSVVDENLNLIKNSMFKMQKLKKKEKTLQKLIVQNNITGCSVLINRELIRVWNFKTRGALMHDWWLGLVAVCFGKIKFLNCATVKYRQHENNFVGAENVSDFKYLLRKVLKRDEILESVNCTYAQCENFLNGYYKELKEEQREILERYLKIKGYCKIRRIFSLIYGGFLKDGVIRRIGQLIFS